jgi:Cys-tRNA(Pro)/Cys-tRNA(Cys) deacylase
VAGRGTTATLALERAKIPFTVHEYAHDPKAESYGREASQALGVSPDRVFKTLVAEVDGTLVVGVVPVEGQLDLKALAAASGGKRAAMAQVTAAERATGYVAGGISPVGQRKRLPVVVDPRRWASPPCSAAPGGAASRSSWRPRTWSGRRVPRSRRSAGLNGELSGYGEDWGDYRPPELPHSPDPPH